MQALFLYDYLVLRSAVGGAPDLAVRRADMPYYQPGCHMMNGALLALGAGTPMLYIRIGIYILRALRMGYEAVQTIDRACLIY